MRKHPSLPLMLACAALCLPPLPATAQMNSPPMSSVIMAPAASGGSATSGGSGPSTPAFKDADQKMMKEMSAPSYTGDADRDFVAHMIPHHQGAIDMAQVELKYGKDPVLRRLARQIVAAQEKEIRLMQLWQSKHAQ